MKTLNVSDARNTLPALIESVSTTHKPVLLLRYGKPAAMLVPVVESMGEADPHPLRGLPLTVSEDFDAPSSDTWEACGVAEERKAYRPEEKLRGKAGAKGGRHDRP
jgi:prevent-host-death family protein